MRRTSSILAVALGVTAMACGPSSRAGADSEGTPPGSLAPVARLGEARASHAVVTQRDGRLLFIGGFRKAADGRRQIYSATTEHLDPATNAVTAGPAMHHARAGHAAVALFDGAVLVVGGWGEAGPVRTAEVLDPTTRVWRDAGALDVARDGATATVLDDGRVVVIGGRDETKFHATIEVFTWAPRVPGGDPKGTWASGGTLRSPRSGHTATLAKDGSIYLVGGVSGTGELVAAIERYEPATQTSAVVGTLKQPRHKHATQRLDSGDLLVIGGADERDWNGTLRSTEIFEVATGRTWSGTNLVDPRFKLAGSVVALGHDRFAVVGGAASIEILMTNVSERVATLPTALQFATATRVGGDVVVAGGYDQAIRASADVHRIPLDRFVNQRM